jgi:bacteriocin biosynthesis cyclodehydratase domain-containing protein
MTSYKFKPHFRVEIIAPDTVYLLSEQAHFVLTGNLYCQLAPLLNGKHSTSDILKELQKQFSFTDIQYALQRLEQKGYITKAIDEFTSEISAFWSFFNIDPQIAYKRLQETHVIITCFGNVPTKPLLTALESIGICNIVLEQGNWELALNKAEGKKALVVVLTDEYLKTELQAFNQTALALQQPWLLVKPVGAITWLGPIFEPGKTGCWQCLAQRLYSNREVEAAISEQTQSLDCFSVSQAILPSTLQMSLNQAATEIAKWFILENTPSALSSKILTFNHLNQELQTHQLTRRPQCRACGEPSTQHHFEPLRLNSCQKQYTIDGGHRVCSPEDTLKRFEHHISPITGVVKALIPNLQSGNPHVHSYLALHSFGQPVDLETLRHSLRHKAAGKGRTDLQAKVSGFCEAIERYSGTYHGDEYCITASYTELQAQAIHPHSYLHFSDYQYQNRDNLNQEALIDWVPTPFNETEAIQWTPVWSLTENRYKYFPTALCYYNYPLSFNHPFGVATSNGCAAGNTLEEAILQGFLELVERDSVSIWWYNMLKLAAVDLTSFDDPFFLQVQSYYQSQKRNFWVLDLTTDLQIPVFAAVACNRESYPQQIMIGYGAHFDAKIALSRAVTELNQVWARIQGENINKLGQGLQKWLAQATLDNQPYLLPHPSIPLKVARDYTVFYNEDLREDILKCVALVQNLGLETLVLDQTRPDIGLNVAKVIIPGLRHFFPRFASGRLYDVPVKLKWLSNSLTESQMNPIAMPF